PYRRRLSPPERGRFFAVRQDIHRGTALSSEKTSPGGKKREPVWVGRITRESGGGPGLQWRQKTRYSLPPLLSPPTLFMSAIRGRNIAMTMLPTITARNTIMMGSSNEVMAATALSTSSS